MIFKDEERNTLVLVFGSGSIGIANFENSILFRELEVGPIGEEKPGQIKDAEIDLQFKSVSSVESLIRRLEEVKNYLLQN